MRRKTNFALYPIAGKLRKDMTKEERHLWYDFLRNYPVQFKRQKVLGKYIADFYCAQAKLVIEIDGGQHYEEEQIERDRLRTMYLEEYGLLVVRIDNATLNKHFADTCLYIDELVKERTSAP